jgi:hypothetical protein
MLDEKEFLSPYGIRALSRCHAEHPYVFTINGQDYRVNYLPAESDSGLFGRPRYPVSGLAAARTDLPPLFEAYQLPTDSSDEALFRGVGHHQRPHYGSNHTGDCFVLLNDQCPVSF